MSSRLNFLSIGVSTELGARCSAICQEFKFSYLSAPDSAAAKGIQFEQVQFVMTSDLAGVKEIRQKFKDAFILAVVSNSDSPANITDVKNAGANQALRLDSLLKKSYLEFISSQVIRAAFIPVKISEFPLNSVLDFSLYHLLPLNQKLLPVLPKGSPLDEARVKKFESIGEVFVRRDEIDRYRMYVEAHSDNASSQGLKSKCRAQYLSFAHAHSQLMFLMADSEEVNFDKESKWLAERCEILGRQLLMTLSSVGEAWDIVNNSSLGEMGSVERAPTIAAYSGLISFLTSTGDPSDVIVASLLSDVGMLELKPEISKKLRESSDLGLLAPEELREYQLHPSESIRLCERKKVPLNDMVKNIIMHSHEKIDGHGFPNKKTKIPEEAMLLQFCELIDREALVKMGHQRQAIKEVRMKIVTELFKDGKTLSDDFLKKLTPVLN